MLGFAKTGSFLVLVEPRTGGMGTIYLAGADGADCTRKGSCPYLLQLFWVVGLWRLLCDKAALIR